MPRYAKKVSHDEIIDYMVDFVINDLETFVKNNPGRHDYTRRELEVLREDRMEALKYFPNVWDGTAAKKDFDKIEFDLENTNWEEEDTFGYEGMVGFQNIGDFNFIGIEAGGDWEFPVYFILYMDDKGLRCYIPKNGNVYDKKRKAAFGNYDIDELDEEGDPIVEYSDQVMESMIDTDALREDIGKRIVVR